VRAEQVAYLASRTMGVVASVAVRAGQRVAAGQLLLKIEANDAAARLDAARSAVNGARERLELAEITWRRYQGLYARAAVSRQEYDQAAASRRQAAAEYERARAQAAEAAVVRDFERLSAPFAGTITRRLVDAGSLAAPGQVLLELESAAPAHLEAAVNEAFSGRLRLGQRLAFEVAGRRAFGLVSEVNPAIDPASRSFLIKVKPESALEAETGAFARIFLPQSSRRALVAPETALVWRGQLAGVYVLDAQQRLRYRIVRPGEPTVQGREILAGLRPGETVVSGGLEHVVEGARLAGVGKS
jgi:RND family efflux transporter MFP subunit